MSANLTIKAFDDLDGLTFGVTARTGADAGGGGGGDFVTDTFTETSDTSLASHTGEVGATWTLHPIYSGTITVDGTLDRIYLTSAAAGGYYASGTPGSADYYVQADFRRLSQFSNNVGIALAMDTAADTMILLRLNDNGTTVNWELFDRITGANTTLGTTSSHIPSVGGAAITVKLVRTGTAITVFFDGVQDGTLNATSTITATGKAGIRASGTASSSTGIHIDTFSAR